MVRLRRPSAASDESGLTARDQELGHMYDFLAKIILLGPSGSGKSCLLHQFMKNEWRVLTSQTIGVEFASKIVKVGTGARRKRIKFQIWDTAGTERFRSVSRSYYRNAAGAILVYDIASHPTFACLPAFLNDARALASPKLIVMLVGNKLDLAEQTQVPLIDTSVPPATSPSNSSRSSSIPFGSVSSTSEGLGLGAQLKASVAPDGREVSADAASKWASTVNIPVSVEASALSGENVEEVFHRLARMILTKIELGEIDPDDPMSGIQYGDGMGVSCDPGASSKSGLREDFSLNRRRRGCC